MKSSRRTVSIALRSRAERRSPRRPSSPIFASRSRRRSSSPLTGWLGGGMTHPLFIGLLSLGPVGAKDFIVVDRGSQWDALLARSPLAGEAMTPPSNHHGACASRFVHSVGVAGFALLSGVFEH